MELNIEELIYDANFDDTFGFNTNVTTFKEIPENNVPIKVVKKGVRFDEHIKPIHQPIPRENARMVRQTIPKPKPQISYDDILSKMGMFVSEGKLHLFEDVNNKQQQQQQHQQQQQQQQQQYKQPQYQQNVPPNSYIYNKYFKEEMQPTESVRIPKTKDEYKRMLLEDILQREQIKQIKSKRLLMPTSNINISSGGNSGNFNKLFNFPKKN